LDSIVPLDEEDFIRATALQQQLGERRGGHWFFVMFDEKNKAPLSSTYVCVCVWRLGHDSLVQIQFDVVGHLAAAGAVHVPVPVLSCGSAARHQLLLLHCSFDVRGNARQTRLYNNVHSCIHPDTHTHSM